MRTLHDLPVFRDRWSYLYLEYGTLDQKSDGLCFENKAAVTAVPIDQLSLIMLGPGTTITHAAVKGLANNACLLAWTGQEGIKFYAYSTGATYSSRRLITQARLASDEKRGLEVVVKMYKKHFPDDDIGGKSIEQIRGMEGQRVRACYKRLAEEYGIEWTGRVYNQDNWFEATPTNRALSAANSCLYGVCAAAIVAAGYSLGLGFIHSGKQLSFVYDIADLYKTEMTVPVAFRLTATEKDQLERKVRMACRDSFHAARLMDRILPDIAEVLYDGDDLGESPDELEGVLSRWLIQPLPGTFLGNPSRRVRDELWLKACKKLKGKGRVLQMWSARNEQGFDYRQHGDTSHWLLDYEGLALVTRLRRQARTKKALQLEPAKDDNLGGSPDPMTF